MRPVTRVGALLLSFVLVAACESGDSEAASTPSMDEVVAAVDKLPSVSRVVRLTKDTDPEQLLGRPNGYDHGALFYDSRLKCMSPGIECGALLEVWDDADEAKRRSAYIQALLDGVPMLGSEHHYLEGRMLLRVDGKLRPSAAKGYEAALQG